MQATTQTWGDGNPANGVPPGFASDILGAGDIIVLEDSITTGMVTGDEDPNDPANDLPLQNVIDFDGRDRVGTTCATAVTRAGWASTGTLNAGATEVWSVSDLGTTYTLPVGENTAQADDDFEVSNVSILATADSTTVDIDHDADGTVDVIVVLDEGETYYLDSSNLAINEGATIVASDRISVTLATGDENTNYEQRWFGVLPEERWDSCYYAPTNEQPSSAVRIFLYNSSGAAIDVEATDGTGALTNINIPAGESRTYDMPTAPVGAELCSADGTQFYALAAVTRATRPTTGATPLCPMRCSPTSS